MVKLRFIDEEQVLEISIEIKKYFSVLSEKLVFFSNYSYRYFNYIYIENFFQFRDPFQFPISIVILVRITASNTSSEIHKIYIIYKASQNIEI